MWMPHDDSFPPDYVTKLVACLETQPDALLAFGRLHDIELDGSPVAWQRSYPDWETIVALDEPWTVRTALRLLIDLEFGDRFPRSLPAGADPPAGADSPYGQGYRRIGSLLMFAVALVGRLAYVPACSCRKRIYPWSTHQRWYTTSRRVRRLRKLNGLTVSLRYLWRYTANRQHRWLGTAVLLLWALPRPIFRAVAARRRIERLLRVEHSRAE